MTKQRYGFSLVEALVTLAVLAVIVALLLPVASRARESAQQVECITRLKHLWNGWMHHREVRKDLLYTGGNAWLYEMAETRGLVTGEETICPSALDVKSGAYFYPNPYSGHIGLVRHWSGPPAKPIGYTVNNWAFYAGSGISSAKRFTKLSTTPLFFDGTVYGLSAAAWNDKELLIRRVAFRHNGVANFLFLDGHVESLDRERVKLLDPKPF